MPAMPAPTDLVFDPAAVITELQQLRAALARRDWTAARAVLDAAEPALRSYLISMGGVEVGVEDLLSYVLARDPDDGAAGAMLGSHLIKTGWAIRTGASAKHVSQEQFAAFHDWLRRAEQVLIEAAARNPSDCAVWVQRLTSARGLQLGLSEVRRRYDRLAAIDPHHLPGQLQFLQSLCPKWSGTWQQVHTFARECMLAAPPGSPQGMLVAKGHLEQWADRDGGEAGRLYLSAEPVRAELHEAAHRSVWHPQYRDRGWVQTMSTFAMVFSLIGDEPAAATLFTSLGDHASEDPWNYLGDPAEQIRTRRARALAIGAQR